MTHPGSRAFRVMRGTLVACLLFFVAGNISAQCLRTVPVANSTQLSTALSAALPGDCIVLANGTYSAFTITRDGTAANPIIIKAASQGGAIVSSGTIRLTGTAYVTVDGLRITSPGSSINVDDRDRNVIVSFYNADNCRITNCTFKPTTMPGNTNWVMLSGASNNNRVDHNEFGPTPNFDVHFVWPCGHDVIPGVTKPADRTPWAEGNGPNNPRMARNTRIDHNHFIGNGAGNGGEAIVLGGIGMTGDYQLLGTIVEFNLFEDCSGDSEVISIKASGNIIRYNTLRRCKASIVSRAGNQNRIEGNFIFGEGVSGTGGIRFYEKDHVIFNNYIESVSAALLVGNGDDYAGTFSHAQTFRAKIVHNTFISAAGGAVNLSYGSHALRPVSTTFANNIVRSTSGSCVTGVTGPTSPVFAQNILTPTGTGTPGASGTGWLNVDAQLSRVGELLKLTSGSPAINAANTSYYSFVTDDADGQARTTPDIGADEFSGASITRQPLTGNDVGPGPDDPEPPACVPVVASGDDGNVAANVLDDNLSTRWSANGDGQWIQFCLNTPQTVTGVKIAFYNGNTRTSTFDVLIGNDGINWSVMGAGIVSSGTTLNLESFNFSLTPGKYVRIVGHGNSVNSWNSYTEVVIMTTNNSNTYTMFPLHDAYVRDGTNAGITHGITDSTLLITKLSPAGQLNNNRESYLQFDLSAVAGITGTITRVTFNAFGKVDGTAVPGVPVSLFPVTNTTWTESTLTWNNKPAAGSTALGTATVPNTANTLITYDITSHALAELAASRTKMSFVMRSDVAHDPRVFFGSDESASGRPFIQVETSTGGNAQQPAPQHLTLERPAETRFRFNHYPNPFKVSSTITFRLEKAGQTNLSVFDITGKRVAVLLNGYLPAGNHQTIFTPGIRSTGIYIMKLEHNGKTVIGRVMKN